MPHIDDPKTQQQDARRRPLLLVILIVILAAETLLLLGCSLWFGAQFFVEKPNNFAGALLILVLTVLATVWLALTTIGTWRMRPWVRGSVLTWQLCQTAVAAGVFQGLYAQPLIGLALLLPALAAGFLLFTPSVIAVTKRD